MSNEQQTKRRDIGDEYDTFRDLHGLSVGEPRWSEILCVVREKPCRAPCLRAGGLRED
jgi:hypothetical protein